MVSLASDFEIRVDMGVRRHRSIGSSRTFVGTIGGTLQFNAFGGYPKRQIGFFGGYQHFDGVEHGGEALLGVGVGTSHARGEHFQYEPMLVLRFKGHRVLPLFRFKLVAIRLPPFLSGVPTPPPLDLAIGQVDAGGVPANPRWQGGSGKDVDHICRFSYIQMSGTPLLVFRPECVDNDHPTLVQPISPETAKHGGFTCGVRDAEPVIRGHINWFVVNQTGRLRWGGFAGGLGDHDFDLFMDAPNLVTHGNVKANRHERSLKKDPQRDSLIELEFNGVETIGHFSTRDGGELWDPLINLTNDGLTKPATDSLNARADRLLRDRPAVVTGLLGLDGEHDFHTELHPVVALAADVSHEQHDPDEHAWLVFIRNMGGEGECSEGQLPWVSRDTTRYVLEIPWKRSADAVVVEIDKSRFGFIARRAATLKVEVDTGRSIRLVADLPRPTRTDSTGIVYGTLRLRWLDHGVLIPHDSAASPPAVDMNPEHRRDERGYEPVDAQLPPTQRLCVLPGRRVEEARRDSPQSFPAQAVLRDSQSPAPTIRGPVACNAGEPATAP